MGSSKDYAQYVTEDLMSEIDGVSARAMFGGFGMYKDGVIFGLIVENQLYFKVDETTVEKYKKLGSKPFEYEMRGKVSAMPYWLVPEPILDDAEELRAWVEEAEEISLKAKLIKKPVKKKTR
jgi:DNA transformation protein